MTRKYKNKKSVKQTYAPKVKRLKTQKQIKNQVRYMPETEVYRGYLAGVGHYDYKKVENKLKSGAAVLLVGEPNNKYDRTGCAIRVELDGHKLGYISARDGSNQMLWEYKKGGAKFRAEIASYNENNPSYTALSVVVFISERAPSETGDPRTDGEVDF